MKSCRPAVIRPELASYDRQHLGARRRGESSVVTSLRKPTLQKKDRRKLMGWLRPKRCPHCRQYTRQVQLPMRGGLQWRRCLSCKGQFTGQHWEAA